MKVFTPLFQAVIAFVAVLTGLGFVFNLLLAPVKRDIEKLEAGQAKLEAGQAEIKQLFYEFKNHSHDQPKQASKNK